MDVPLLDGAVFLECIAESHVWRIDPSVCNHFKSQRYLDDSGLQL